MGSVAGTTAWMESKQEPSLTAMKENPALESRRVRTQPLTVMVELRAALPARAWAMAKSGIWGSFLNDEVFASYWNWAVGESLSAVKQDVEVAKGME